MVHSHRREGLLCDAGTQLERRGSRSSNVTDSATERHAGPASNQSRTETWRAQSGISMNVLYCLRRAKQINGTGIASHSEQGPVTWDEFYDRVYRAAAFLRDLGIQKGDRVAVWMLNSHEYLELYYATALAGIVIVPLNTRWHENDVEFTLRDSDAVALIVDAKFAPQAARFGSIARLIY